MLDGSDILLDDVRGMTAGVEVSDVVRKPVPQGIGPDAVTVAGSTELGWSSMNALLSGARPSESIADDAGNLKNYGVESG